MKHPVRILNGIGTVGAEVVRQVTSNAQSFGTASWRATAAGQERRQVQLDRSAPQNALDFRIKGHVVNLTKPKIRIARQSAFPPTKHEREDRV